MTDHPPVEPGSEADAATDPYGVRLGVFEGPLDLLLYLIRKNEVDIYDIPIATITARHDDLEEEVTLLKQSVRGWQERLEEVTHSETVKSEHQREIHDSERMALQKQEAVLRATLRHAREGFADLALTRAQ